MKDLTTIWPLSLWIILDETLNAWIISFSLVPDVARTALIFNKLLFLFLRVRVGRVGTKVVPDLKDPRWVRQLVYMACPLRVYDGTNLMSWLATWAYLICSGLLTLIPEKKIFFLETGLHIPKLLRNLFSEVSEYVFLYFCSFYNIQITNTPRGKR